MTGKPLGRKRLPASATLTLDRVGNVRTLDDFKRDEAAKAHLSFCRESLFPRGILDLPHIGYSLLCLLGPKRTDYGEMCQIGNSQPSSNNL